MRLRTFLAAGFAIAAALLAAAQAGAHPPGNGHVHPAGPTLQGWVLLGEPGKKGKIGKINISTGAMVFTGPIVGGFASASEADNPANGASGFIAELGAAGPHCKCRYHFHGTMFGLPDPDPDKCGWGCAVPSNGTDKAVVELAEAFNHETEALGFLLLTPDQDDIDDAIDLLEDSIDDLEDIVSPGPAAKGGPVPRKNKLAKLVDSAIDLDEDAIDALEEADIEEARDLIAEALATKQKILKALKPKIPKPSDEA